ncbi:MAG: VWA domain-containing protein [Lachnospiraceae bacterium]|nr:VWA domain-containing protein [Lachnospiraceae bacterium]
MKKIILSMSLFMLLVCCIPVSVSASLPEGINFKDKNKKAEQDEAELVSAYGQNGILHAFVRGSGDYSPEQIVVELNEDEKNGISASDGAVNPVPLAQSGSGIQYYFIVDGSGSMKGKYTEEVMYFVEEIVKRNKERNEESHVRYAVMKFGNKDEFETVWELSDDTEGLLDTLTQMKYEYDNTDLYNGMLQAFEKVDGMLGADADKDFINLILITDGGQDVKKGEYNPELSRANDIKTKIESEPEKVVHTICLGEWAAVPEEWADGPGDDFKTAGDVFETGKGIHAEPTDVLSATLAGKELAEFTDSIYRADFTMTGGAVPGRFPVKLTFSNQSSGVGSTKNASFDSVVMLGQGSVSANAAGTDNDSSASDEAGKAADEQKTDGTEDEETSDDRLLERENEDSEEEISSDDDFSDDDSDSIEEKEDASKLRMVVIVLLIGLAAALAGALVVFLIMRRKLVSDRNVPKKDRREAGERAAAGGREGIGGRREAGERAAAGGREGTRGRREAGEYEGARGRAQAEGYAGAGGRAEGNDRARRETAGIRGSRPKSENAIPLQLEILEGEYVTGAETVYLDREIMIGSGSDCDIVFDDPDMNPINSRIFVKGQEIYIEDLDSELGTAIGGMRIYAPNKLRSGDEILVGASCFQVWF